jgi:hypothetical protein
VIRTSIYEFFTSMSATLDSSILTRSSSSASFVAQSSWETADPFIMRCKARRARSETLRAPCAGIEAGQDFGAGKIGQTTGAVGRAGFFQAAISLLAQATYRHAVSSVTVHNSSRAQAVMKRRAICACGAPSTAQTISRLISTATERCRASTPTTT